MKNCLIDCEFKTVILQTDLSNHFPIVIALIVRTLDSVYNGYIQDISISATH